MSLVPKLSYVYVGINWMNGKGYDWKNYENEVGRIVEFCWF